MNYAQDLEEKIFEINKLESVHGYTKSSKSFRDMLQKRVDDLTDANFERVKAMNQIEAKFQDIPAQTLSMILFKTGQK